MEKANMIAAVEDLNLVLFSNDANSIPTDIDPEIIQEKLKQAAVLLYASDKLEENTIEILRELEWTDDDFKDLPDGVDPVPAFQRFGIGPYEEKPEEYTESAPPKTKPKKREGPSAYGTALALVGKDPKIPLHELYEVMKEHGFDLKTATGTTKTAHSVGRKMFRYFVDNGHAIDWDNITKEEASKLITRLKKVK